MVGHDDVDAEFVGSRDRRSRSNAVVDADDETDSARRGRFYRGGLHSIAVVEAMGDVPARFRSGQFQGFFEDDGGGYSIDVVVAVDLDLSSARYGLADASTARSMSRRRKGSCRSAMRGFRKRSGGCGIAESPPDRGFGQRRLEGSDPVRALRSRRPPREKASGSDSS